VDEKELEVFKELRRFSALRDLRRGWFGHFAYVHVFVVLKGNRNG
jgi:hypothetical protein